MSLESILIIILLAIVLFVLLRWMLKRLIKVTSSRNWIAGISAVVLAPVFYFIGLLGFMSLLFYQPEYKFSKDRWAAEKEIRYRMKDDLISKGMLDGKSTAEVLDLIGAPDKDSAEVWTYDLGMSQEGFGWKWYFMDLEFQEDTLRSIREHDIVD